jgi:hypothetical protein
MVNAPASCLGLFRFLAGTRERKQLYRHEDAHKKLGPLVAVVLLAPLLFAQGTPQVTGVEPSSGKVNDNVTVTGENLGKGSVLAVFLSDDKNDYKAAVVEQAADKIVMKVPQVRPGDYNVSIEVGNKILIEPVRFKVQN